VHRGDDTVVLFVFELSSVLGFLDFYRVCCFEFCWRTTLCAFLAVFCDFSLFEIVVGIVWFEVLMYLFARVLILFSCADIGMLQGFRVRLAMSVDRREPAS